MGTRYVPEIFVPSEKRILSLHFMAAILSHRRDSSLLLHQPAKCLCVTCVMFLFGTEFGLCVLLQCAGCFWGCFTALKSSLHNIQFLVLLIYSNKVSIIVKQKEPIMPIQTT